MLAVVMVNVGDHRGMGVAYANRLRSDVMKHLSVPHRVYCYTEEPACFYPRTRCKPHPLGVAWHPSRLFRPGSFVEDRIMLLSLDTILLRDIDLFAEYEGEAAASAHGHVCLWRNGFVPKEEPAYESLEDIFPGVIVPYQPYLPESARVVTFDAAPHLAGGWVAEHWELEAA